MKHYQVPEPRRKSVGEQMADTLLYLIICGTVYYLLTLIAKVFIAPFKFLFMSDRDRFAAKLERSKAKVQARELARVEFDTSEENPMVQYLLRFRQAPENYRNDSENNTYRKWFEALKKGTILDTELQWAPDVYVKTSTGKMYNEDFLNYFSRQFDLHETANVKSKIKFMNTIRKFYPEFTPKFSAIPFELKDLYERLHSKKLNAELVEAIHGNDVPLELAKDLVKDGVSAGKIKSSIHLVRKCRAIGWGDAGCRFAAKHDYDPDEHEDCVNEAVNNIMEKVQNEKIALAMLRGDIGPQELNDLIQKAMRGNGGGYEELLGNIDRDFMSFMKAKTLKQVAGR
jgi:hypothetical protein